MLDRKNPYSAIPQLEKKIDNVETGQEEIGLDYSAFKEKTKEDLIVIDGELVDVNADLLTEINRATNSENDIDDDVNGITVFTDGTHDVYKDHNIGEYYYLDANEERVIVQESALVTEGGDLKTKIEGGKTDVEETKEIIETLAQKVGVDEFSDNKAFVETYLGSSGYVSLEGSSLTLGRGDFVAKLDERFLGFYRSNSGSPVALIGQNEVGEGIMSIDKGEISSDLSFGKFQWITRSNGNLTLKWKE